MPPTVMSVAALSRETDIPSLMLYAWKKHYRSEGFVVPSKLSPSDQLDAKTKLAAVIETAALNQADVLNMVASMVCIPNNWTHGKPCLRASMRCL